jgi:homogentisate 1,2-dioxygenase
VYGGGAYSDHNRPDIGTIPKGQNSPRVVRFGLYAEQMTASSFVAPRHLNKKVSERGVLDELNVTDRYAGMVV